MTIDSKQSPLIQWETDENGVRQVVQVPDEEIKIINNTAILNYKPSEYHRVTLDNIMVEEETIEFIELDIKEKIENVNQYKVNYNNGIIFFHPALDGFTLTVSSYFSEGMILYHVSRIYYRDANDVIVTLEEYLNSITEIIGNLNIAGLKVLDRYSSLSALKTAHPTGNSGDTYAVGTETSNVIYVWSTTLNDWINIGSLKGDAGSDGSAATITLGTVTTGGSGTDVIITNSGTSSAAVLNFTIPRGTTGATGNRGATGATGNGITSIVRTSGTGAAGTTDTYTITFTNGTTTTFQVYNGANGTGSGDMTKIVYDPNNKNADAFNMDNMVEGTTNKILTSGERTKLTNTSGTNTGNETTTTIGTLINGATAKTSPVDADYIPLMDSAESNIMKKLSWAYVKSVLNTYFLSNTQTLINKTLTAPKITSTSYIADSNGNRLIKFPSPVPSAVNEITVSNAAAGDAPSISATGGNTNIPFDIKTKGTGLFRTFVNGVISFVVDGVTSAVNYIKITNSSTGNAPTIEPIGTDSNISINIKSKGTGTVKANTYDIITSNDVVNNLTTDTEGDVLDASQGKVLNDLISTHAANTSNPHNATASQVGAIPQAPASAISDANLVGESGKVLFHKTNSSSLNTPYAAGLTSGNSGGTLITALTSTDFGMQMYFMSGSVIGIPEMFIRPFASGTWGSWFEITGMSGGIMNMFLRTIKLTSGSGAPEGVVTAPIGSLYLRSDGGTSTTLYVKQSGTGNTGWVAK